ncbi:SGNH/GDSL hydrolase family protein [Thalassoglobus polymorphus]|uniref:SGNH hydrolase-type esterase domain-containing protein n=1 Tax=Thalassoglobus polymorphus TaxID=2527994 RepID=A0A517QTL9_9PLAN|nr:SGNH/GDSL hydrolase family protein [Thalassoglobus polymorphus]QDT34887.1 hypothetical protein Mal48_41600 [Thalassoglobus polymorphus]
MIRSLLRTFSRFLAAVVLFGLILCAVEVWFRWNRLDSVVNKAPRNSEPLVSQVVKPSSTTFLEVTPLLKTEMPVSLTEQALLRTNEFGTRGEKIAIPKPPGVFRVLCLGGSGIFGMGVREEETLTGHLQLLFAETGLKHVEFVNAGCPGSGPLTNYLRLRQRFIALQPDLVVLCLRPEEVELDRDVRGGLTLDEHGNPAFASHPNLQAKESHELAALCEEFATADWVIGKAGPLFGLSNTNASVPVSSDEPISLKPLVSMWSFTQSINADLMISIVPNAWDLEPQTGRAPSRNALAFDRDLHAYFADRGIDSLTLIHNSIQLFEQTGDRTLFFYEKNGHLTPTGNSLYARSLAKSIVDHVPEILQPEIPPTLPAPSLKSSPLNTETQGHSLPLTREKAVPQQIVR